MSLLDHLYDNWKAIYALPEGPEKKEQMRIVKMLTRGNLHWLVRRLIGGIPSDGEENIKKWIAAGEMLPPSKLQRLKRHENRKSKDQQHS